MTTVNVLVIFAGLVLLVLFGGFLILGALTGSPLSKAGVESSIRKAFTKAVRGRPERRDASLLVYSAKVSLDLLIRENPSGLDAFHIASVGKLITTVMVGRLIDAGKLQFGTRVAPILDAGSLDGLFVVDGHDHQAEVTVDHLLSHTSGLADYFADQAKGGQAVFQLLVSQPDRSWTPVDLLDFCRTRQTAVAKPGAMFHYSDTGFIILGLLVEKLTGQTFESAVGEQILRPLGMERTWFPFRTFPAVGAAAMRPAWMSGVDVSRSPSITADWAGGGIASTERDLLAFQTALQAGKLVSPDTLAVMRKFDNRFQQGILYGRGMMELRFGEFMFLLNGYPRMTGHMGVLATQLFYDPVHDLHVIASFGSDAAMEDSVRLIISVLGAVRRLH